MIRNRAIFLSLFVAIFTAGCGNSANSPNTANNSSTASKQSASSPSPAETLKEYVEAARSRDLAKLRQTASKRSIEMMDELLVEEGSTLEETIKKSDPAIPPMFENPEVRNEKINGNRASIEVKQPGSGEWMEVPFVMEEGRWKLAAGEQFDAEMEKVPSVEDHLPSNSNGNRTGK